MTEYLSRKIRIVSVWAIVMVVLQHAINFTGYIDRASVFGVATADSALQYAVGYGIARPAVALFFILSGYLFFRNYTLAATSRKYRSRIRSLVVPYILWNTLAVAFVAGVQALPPIGAFYSSLYTGFLPGKPYVELAFMALNHGVAFQTWFLSDLMLFVLLSPFLYVAVRYLGLFVVLPLALVWMAGYGFPAAFGAMERGGVFYLIGAYLALRPASIPERQGRGTANVFIALWALSIALKTYVALVVTPFSSLMTVIDNIVIALGAISVWFMYDAIADSRFIAVTESQSAMVFFVFAAHEPLLEMVKYLLLTALGRGPLAQSVAYIGSIVVTYGVCVIGARTLRRISPNAYGLLTGSRG